MSKSYFVGFEKFLAYWILLMHIQFHFPEPKSIIFAQMKRERIAEVLYFHTRHIASLFTHVLNPSDVTARKIISVAKLLNKNRLGVKGVKSTSKGNRLRADFDKQAFKTCTGRRMTTYECALESTRHF